MDGTPTARRTSAKEKVAVAEIDEGELVLRELSFGSPAIRVGPVGFASPNYSGFAIIERGSIRWKQLRQHLPKNGKHRLSLDLILAAVPLITNTVLELAQKFHRYLAISLCQRSKGD